MKTADKISKAKANLILEQPFQASLLCSMPVVEAKPGELPIPTMGTNGKWIKYDPEFVDELSMDELKFVLCHEVMHNVFCHMFRRGERDPRLWNIAGDYIINDLLVDERVGSMPKGGIHDKSVVQAGGGTADGVYDLLNQQQQKGGGGGSGPDQFDSCIDADGSAADKAQAEAGMKVAVAQAAQAAKMCGKLSAGLQRFVDDALKAKVDWRDVLRRFVTARARVEYTYARPKRRFLADDLYLPSLGGEAMGKILIAVDCSGSIGVEELNEFAAEIKGIKQDCKPAGIDVVYFDSRVCHHDHFDQDDDLHIEPHGGGGTAFSPIWAFAEDQGMEPVCAVVLTDLYCHDFGDPQPFPVLWITTAATAAPWGEVVEMNPKR